MSPERNRAACGSLGWSQADLAKRAEVGLSTVKDFERGRRTPARQNLGAMTRAIEAAGVRLLFGNEGRPAGITTDDPGGTLPDQS